MNILYCGDASMTDGLLISILSLTESIHEPLHVYVLTAALTTSEKTYEPIKDAHIEFCDDLVKRHHAESSVVKLDITRLFTSMPPSANMDTIFTPYCMLRLYSDLLDLPDRILYLDTDVVCRQDFTDFYYQTMDDVEVAGVLDYYGRWFFRKNYWSLWPDYLNSGLLLLNLGKIRQTGLFRRCRQMCQTKKMFMPDQSALNKLVDRKRVAPRRFNEQRRLKNNTVFQHFTTSFRLWPTVHTVTVKPWDIERVHSELDLHEYDHLLNRYQSLKNEMELIK